MKRTPMLMVILVVAMVVGLSPKGILVSVSLGKDQSWISQTWTGSWLVAEVAIINASPQPQSCEWISSSIPKSLAILALLCWFQS